MLTGPHRVNRLFALLIIFAFLTVASPVATWAQQHESPQTASAPSSAPSTLSDELIRLRSIQKPHDDEIALRAALEFVAAIGDADGPRAAKIVDVVGYQPLPFTGALPDPPAPSHTPAQIQQWVTSRPKVAIGALSSGSWEALNEASGRISFPAVTRWMLPEDHLFVFHAGGPEHWLTRDACVVVRTRGSRPTIVGGNLIAALSAPSGG